jgi:hypothetical protein
VVWVCAGCVCACVSLTYVCFDAGLLGSGMPETFEMLRILRYVSSSLLSFPQHSIKVPIEFQTLLASLQQALATYSTSAKDNDAEFAYWDASNTAREAYRLAVQTFFLGTKVTLQSASLAPLFASMEAKVVSGISRALLTTSIPHLSPSYFTYDCRNYTVLEGVNEAAGGTQAKSFEQKTLPLFLEGPTKHLKVRPCVMRYYAVTQSPFHAVGGE